MSKAARIQAALEAARHELATLHGLLAADGAAPGETWTINVATTLALIDAALATEPDTKEEEEQFQRDLESADLIQLARKPIAPESK